MNPWHGWLTMLQCLGSLARDDATRSRAAAGLPQGVLKSNGTGWAEVLLRIARARGSAKHYSTNVLIHKGFTRNSQYFKVSHKWVKLAEIFRSCEGEMACESHNFENNLFTGRITELEQYLTATQPRIPRRSLYCDRSKICHPY